MACRLAYPAALSMTLFFSSVIAAAVASALTCNAPNAAVRPTPTTGLAIVIPMSPAPAIPAPSKPPVAAPPNLADEMLDSNSSIFSDRLSIAAVLPVTAAMLFSDWRRAISFPASVVPPIAMPAPIRDPIMPPIMPPIMGDIATPIRPAPAAWLRMNAA